MSVATQTSKQVIQEYFAALMGQPKTAQLIDRYVADPELKKHILETDAAFPGYYIHVHSILADDDLVAVRGTVYGTQKGAYMGFPATGRDMSQSVMVFYRVTDGLIQQFWMEMNPLSMLEQLKG